MRIVFIGTGEIGVPTLRALLDSGHEVVAVVTQPDKPVGREQRIEPPPIKKVLTTNGGFQTPKAFGAGKPPLLVITFFIGGGSMRCSRPTGLSA